MNDEYQTRQFFEPNIVWCNSKYLWGSPKTYLVTPSPIYPIVWSKDGKWWMYDIKDEQTKKQ